MVAFLVQFSLAARQAFSCISSSDAALVLVITVTVMVVLVVVVVVEFLKQCLQLCLLFVIEGRLDPYNCESAP